MRKKSKVCKCGHIEARHDYVECNNCGGGIQCCLCQCPEFRRKQSSETK